MLAPDPAPAETKSPGPAKRTPPLCRRHSVALLRSLFRYGGANAGSKRRTRPWIRVPFSASTSAPGCRNWDFRCHIPVACDTPLSKVTSFGPCSSEGCRNSVAVPPQAMYLTG